MTTGKEQKIISKAAAQGVPEAVRQKCLGRPLGSVLLSRIYAVPSGWETSELSLARGIVVANTVEALDAAFRSPEPHEIVLLKSAGITLEALKARLETQGNAKTVFLEQ